VELSTLRAIPRILPRYRSESSVFCSEDDKSIMGNAIHCPSDQPG